jgi:DNA-binding beta-propeller fold protein YncE
MRRCSRWLGPVAAAATLAFGGLAGASVMAGGADLSAQRGSIRLDGSPGVPAANLQTHTLYVPIQCGHANSCPGKPTGHVLDIIDTSRCNISVVSGCRVVGTAPGGDGPLAVTIDEKTDTVYVEDGSGAVSVLDGGRCNAVVRTRCGVLATIRTGGFDVAGALNPKTHTLYTAAPSVGVFAINVARCNANTIQGCHQNVRKVKDPRGPDAVDVDLATNTVYAADGGTNSPGDTVSVISGANCDGSTGRGCGHAPRTITVGSVPFWVTVDQATDTVYVANNNDGTVSVINGARCNATATSGCQRALRAVGTGGGVAYMSVDESRHTLFAINQTDDTISEINTRTCNGHTASGCPQRARNERATFNPPRGENPGAFALIPATGTAYLVTPGSGAFLAAVSIKRCNALTTAGCRVEAPSVPLDLAFPEVDPATDTIYAANGFKPGIAVLNGATCNAHRLSGCTPVATIPFAHPQANLGSIDQSTHTLYAADTFANTLWAINIQHCNAHDTSGCSATASKVTVGPGPGLPVLDPATHTLYVPEGANHSNQIAVVDASTCNATNTSGCGQKPAHIQTGINTYTIGLSTSTDTVYAMVLGPNFLNNTVWVINGATCNATDHAGCATAVTAKAKVGPGPFAVAVDDATHTVYVAINASGEAPGTVSVINGATCNGSKTSSCGSTKPAVTVGRSPVALALDPSANRLYVADYSHAAVSIVDTSSCNSGHVSGCSKPAPEQNVGSQPGNVVVNQMEKTVYAPTHDLATGGGAWSIFPTAS